MGKYKRTKPKFNSKSKKPYKRSSRYTMSEKQSYWMGVGAGFGARYDNPYQAIERFACNPKNKESFANGLSAQDLHDVSVKLRSRKLR